MNLSLEDSFELVGPGRAAEVLAFWRNAVGGHQNDALAHAGLSQALLRAHEPDKAMAEALRAVELQPESWQAHVALGDAYVETQRRQDAEESYRRAVALAPVHSGPHELLSRFLAWQYRCEEALMEAQESERLEAASEGSRLAFAVAYYCSGQYSLALREIDPATSAAPGVPRLHSFRGIILWDSGRTADGEAELRRAMELDPSDATSRWWLANRIARQRRTDEALDLLNAADELDPGSVGVGFGRATVYVLLGRLAEAEKLLRDLVERDPDSGNVHYWLGIALARLNRTSESEREFVEAIRLCPGSGFAHRELAAAYLRRLNYTAANRELQTALRWLPFDGPTHLLSIIGYFGTGRPVSAFREVIAAIRLGSPRAAWGGVLFHVAMISLLAAVAVLAAASVILFVPVWLTVPPLAIGAVYAFDRLHRAIKRRGWKEAIRGVGILLALLGLIAYLWSK